AAFRRWQFALRPGVKFSDGVPLTAAEVVGALSALLPEGIQVSVSGNSVIFQCSETRPDLLEVLASGRSFVFRVLGDGSLAGTGAFTLDDGLKNAKGASDSSGTSQPTLQRLHFSANESCWAGRPFLDAIDITLGVPPLRALFDLQVGKADLVELAPDVVRRANQSNTQAWS